MNKVEVTRDEKDEDVRVNLDDFLRFYQDVCPCGSCQQARERVGEKDGIPLTVEEKNG